MKYLSNNLEDTKRFAGDFVSSFFAAPALSAATVVGLYGNLGSGKTTFVRCVADILGVKEHTTSPTFVIVKSYKLQDKSFKNLIHIDAYRLKSGEELQKLGFKELLRDKGNLIFVEWPEHITGILPANMIKINFEFIDQNTRNINME